MFSVGQRVRVSQHANYGADRFGEVLDVAGTGPKATVYVRLDGERAPCTYHASLLIETGAASATDEE